MRLRPTSYNLCSNQGFTLIEALIYIVLFTIVIGGGMATAFYLIQGTDDLRREALAQAEANFVLRRIDQLLVNADSITSPTNSTDSTLVVDSGDSILLDNGVVYYNSVDPDTQLISGNNEVTELDFTHDGTVTPDKVEVVLTIEERTFHKVYYLR